LNEEINQSTYKIVIIILRVNETKVSPDRHLQGQAENTQE